MDIEESAQPLELIPDRRLRLAQPIPVRLLAIQDVRLLALVGLEKQLDDLYVGILEFERDKHDAHAFVADNCRLIFQIIPERPVIRQSVKPLGIEVLNLGGVEKQLVEAKLDYVRQRGITPGSESLVMQDPGGNWIEIMERRELI